MLAEGMDTYEAPEKRTVVRKPYVRSKFTKTEDKELTKLVSRYGTNDWHGIADNLPGRNARQCKDRWFNYLSPNVSNGPWSSHEDELLIEKQAEYGAKWRQIAACFPSRTDVSVKNRWRLLQRAAKRETRLRSRTSQPMMTRSSEQARDALNHADNSVSSDISSESADAGDEVHDIDMALFDECFGDICGSFDICKLFE